MGVCDTLLFFMPYIDFTSSSSILATQTQLWNSLLGIAVCKWQLWFT